jgi:hypothetical protein
MRPKEKAIEIYDKFEEHSTYSFNENKELSSKHHAKQCALIALNEIIQAIRYTEAKKDYGYVGYWNEVKQEIEKL